MVELQRGRRSRHFAGIGALFGVSVRRGVLLFALLLLAGCAGKLRRDYPGANPESVWKAMQGAADSPVYPGWHVTQNGVWSDPEGLRIELFRELKREVKKPGLKPRREQEEWALTLRMLQRRSGPAVEIESHTVETAGRFRVAADEIFDQIESRLAQIPAEIPAPPAVPAPELTGGRPTPLESP